MRMVTLLGDMSVDLVRQNDGSFLPSPGGSVYNTARILAGMDIPIHMVSRLGDDLFGNYLLDNLKHLNINTDFIDVVPGFKTSIAFASPGENGKTSYDFYKNTSLVFSPKPGYSNKILHIGSSFAFAPNSHQAVSDAVKNADFVSYDINLRRRPDSAESDRIFALIGQADIVKGSVEDFELLFGVSGRVNVTDALKIFAGKLVIVTCGDDAPFAVDGGGRVIYGCEVREIKNIKNTIGAGDSFNAGVLYLIAGQSDISLDDPEFIKKMLDSGGTSSYLYLKSTSNNPIQF